jgi:hypothetical protein
LRAWRVRIGNAQCVAALICAGLALPVWMAFSGPDTAARADVVLVVDTSASMAHPGMDPERTSLLVSKLFSDIVPGNLAVIRSLDLARDQQFVPSRQTGRMVPCSEDPTQQCHDVEPANDWYKNARERKFGSLIRPSRGDSGFKDSLNDHLKQTIQNSLFGLGFAAAQGVLDSHGAPQADVPRVVVWLSDGETDDPAQLTVSANELKSSGTLVVPVVFGRGNPEKAQNMGLSPRQVRSPAELVKAFAGVFRYIVQAPFELDHVVADDPTFEMKKAVDEAWVVVYGDDTLGEVTVAGPNNTLRADYAAGRQAGAGAYKVMYVQKPPSGRWTVHVSGGGNGAAFAIIQRCGLTPILLEPQGATAGVPVKVVAGLATIGSQTPLPPADLPEDLVLEVQVNGKTVRLADDGAGDGKFTGMVTFDTIGQVPIVLHAKSTLLDKSVPRTVTVSGYFHYSGGPVEVNLGDFKAPGEACKELRIYADQSGNLPFTLSEAKSLPGGQRFEIRGPHGATKVGGAPILLSPGDPLQLCLEASRSAESSAGQGEHWLDLVAQGNASDSRVPILVRWNLHGLTWWERWRWLIFTVIGVLTLIFWIYGYVKPRRFPRNLALTFVPEKEELYEQTPQPIAQWKGVGIGWYRDAQAFLHPNFRLSGSASGSLASLHALTNSFMVRPENGTILSRETIDGDWELLPPTGRRASNGEAYRVGDQGPYFLVTVRRT